MAYFELIQRRDHEGVFFCNDKTVGLRAIVAIHDTSLGPALGGCRMKSYKSEQEALQDVLRLSRAMSYKSSMAGLNLGGGKSVVILDKPEDKTPELLKAFAERLNLLGGSYIGAGDVGSNTHDLRIMRQYSPHVNGLAEEDGGLGDSAILTSLGVFRGIQAAVQEKMKRDSLDGLKVAVQGAGKVGHLLVEHLINAGCTVFISDINQAALQAVKDEFPAVTICDPLSLFDNEVDVFSPNAIGGVVTQGVAHGLKAKIIAGGANNPLESADVAQVLHERGILYAPDFIVNAGGVIMIAGEIEHYSFEDAKKRTDAIYDTTLRVFDYAKQKNLLPWDAAQHLALERIEKARQSKLAKV
ncbi:MAG: Glu/Leu/Phe/Val dehydrogenase dimerization domain-containing protein [Vampirovibrionales bacterium]|nr:Glu/Leu/Phe/Val dehydrogenase dimerization domain-containing protein [Vampirovibrionales bacterium]